MCFQSRISSIWVMINRINAVINRTLRALTCEYHPEREEIGPNRRETKICDLTFYNSD